MATLRLMRSAQGELPAMIIVYNNSGPSELDRRPYRVDAMFGSTVWWSEVQINRNSMVGSGYLVSARSPRIPFVR